MNYAAVYNDLYRRRGTRYGPREGSHALKHLIPWLREASRELRVESPEPEQVLPYRGALDVGCGLGYALGPLAEFCRPPIVGVDVSLRAVELAHRGGRLNVQTGDARKINFSDNAFDVVVSSDVLEHLEPQHVDDALSELHRVCRRWLGIRVSCRRAGTFVRVRGKRLNAHRTIRRSTWWLKQLHTLGEVVRMEYAPRKQSLDVLLRVEN